MSLFNNNSKKYFFTRPLVERVKFETVNEPADYRGHRQWHTYLVVDGVRVMATKSKEPSQSLLDAAERYRKEFAAQQQPNLTGVRRDGVEGCSVCERIKADGGFGPSHDASPGCESGKHEHCSCDTCF